MINEVCSTDPFRKKATEKRSTEQPYKLANLLLLFSQARAPTQIQKMSS